MGLNCIEIFQNRVKLGHCLQIFYHESPTALESVTFNSSFNFVYAAARIITAKIKSLCTIY